MKQWSLALRVPICVLAVSLTCPVAAPGEPVFNFVALDRWVYYEGNVNNENWDEDMEQGTLEPGPWSASALGGPDSGSEWILCDSGQVSDIQDDEITYTGWSSMDWDVGGYVWGYPDTFAGTASRMYAMFTVDEPLELELTYDVGTVPPAEHPQIYSGVRLVDLGRAVTLIDLDPGDGAGTLIQEVVPGTRYWYIVKDDLAINEGPKTGFWSDAIEATLRIIPVRGDMNCDTWVNLDDVPFFVEALVDPDNFSGCDISRGDINDDTFVDGADVQGFVGLLLPGP